jgi:predicted N-acetyltransferase YhbS
LTEIVPLSAVHPAAVEALLDAAFGADRHQRTAYRVRAGVDWLPALSFAALDGAELVGSVQCWPVALTGVDGSEAPLILLGPIAVDPARQQGGIGRLLTRTAITAAEAASATPLVLIGDPEYYGRFFDFDAAPASGWSLPGPFEPRRLLVRNPGGVPLPVNGLLGPRGPRFATQRRIA